MNAYLGKSCSFGLLCVSCVGVCLFILFTVRVLRGRLSVSYCASFPCGFEGGI